MLRGVLLPIFLLTAFVQTADAQVDGRSRWSVATGIGFQASPDSFLLGFEADYALSDEVSVGGAMQLGIDGDFVVVSPFAYGRYGFRLKNGLAKVRPYVQGGLGLTYISLDVPSGFGFKDSDTGFLMNFGIGAEYMLDDSISLNSRMLFNIIPTDVFGDNFIYTWEIAALRYRF